MINLTFNHGIFPGFGGPAVQAALAGRGGQPVVLRGLRAGELVPDERVGQGRDACDM